MKKIFLLMLIGMFLLSLTTVSAWDWDNTKTETGVHPVTGLPTIEVTNLFGLGETLFEGAVTEHTKQCGQDCSSKLEFNHAGGVLIDDIRFLTLQDDNVSWVKQDIRSYKFLLETAGEQELVDVYETQCTDLEQVCNWSEVNQTETCYTPRTCEQVLVGQELVDKPEFTEYKIGEELPEGSYELFLHGDKKPTRTVDWQIKLSGKWLDEWAVWESSGGKTLYEPVSYWKFDNNNLTDSAGSNDGSNVGTTNSSGIINDARYFNRAENDRISIGLADTGDNVITMNAWIKPDSYDGGSWNMIVSGEGVDQGPYMRITGGTTTQFGVRLVGSWHTASWTGVPTLNEWSMITGTFNGTDVKVYVNGTLKATTTTTLSNMDEWRIDAIGATQGNSRWFDGDIDEVGLWNKALNSTEISALYNSGNPPEYLGYDGYITLNSPADESISNTPSVTFNATAEVTNGAYLTNMSLWTNATGTWALNETIDLTGIIENASNSPLPTITPNAVTGKAGEKINLTTTKTLTSVWKHTGSDATTAYLRNTYGGADLATSTFVGDVATFDYELQAGTIYYILADKGGSSYTASYNNGASKPTTVNDVIWVIGVNQAGAEDTSYSRIFTKLGFDNKTTSSTQTWTKTITDTTIWNVQACDTDGDCGFATSNYTVYLDATAPNITTTLPTGDYEIPYLGWNTTYNATTTDTNLEDCWYSEDQGVTNTTYTCNTAITDKTLLKGLHHLTFYANDSVSNLGIDYSNFTISLYSNISLNFNNAPTCTIDHGSLDANYNWIGETIDRTSTLSCIQDNYGAETWTIEPNQSEYNLTMDYAYLNITFDSAVNATITPSSLGEFTGVTNIFVNQSDIDEGKVTVLYNLQGDGGVQQYTYENDLQTSLDVNLHVISGIFQQTEIKALESSVGLDDAIIRVYEQVSGEWIEIYSEYTNSYGTAIAYVIPDKIYRITGNKDGYQQGSTVETILIGSTDTIYVILSKLASFSYDTDLFYSNCNAQIGTAKDCYSRMDLVEDAGNITIYTVWNDTTYTKTCTDTDVCQTPAYRIANATSTLTSYAVVDKETFPTTISIIFKDFELRLIQFEWAEEIKSNSTYLGIFYILTFLAGIFLAFSVEQKQKGFGKWTISIWFGVLAFTGFALYWFVIIPVIILNLGKLIRGRT